MLDRVLNKTLMDVIAKRLRLLLRQQEKPLIYFKPIFHLWKNQVESTFGRVTFKVKMQVMDLHFYLKCHSPTGVFHTFC